MARVWVLQLAEGQYRRFAPDGFVNGSPLAQSTEGTAFFHDFQPGTYRFTVQPYGTPTNYVDILQLTLGAETYVQVEPVPNWEVGSTSGGGSFIVATMSPQEAQTYLPLTKTLGQR